MAAQQVIREHLLVSRQWVGTPDLLTSDYPLIERGILDSMGIFELIGFLEDTFDIRIKDEDLTPENFQTLDAIVRLVDHSSA